MEEWAVILSLKQLSDWFVIFAQNSHLQRLQNNFVVLLYLFLLFLSWHLFLFCDRCSWLLCFNFFKGSQRLEWTPDWSSASHLGSELTSPILNRRPSHWLASRISGKAWCGLDSSWVGFLGSIRGIVEGCESSLDWLLLLDGLLGLKHRGIGFPRWPEIRG